MKLYIRPLLIASLALAALSAFAQTAPKDALKNIESIRQKAYTDARATGKAPDFAALESAMKAKAEEALKGVDPEKIDAKDSFDWARIYSYAGKHAIVCSLAHKFLTTNPGEDDKFKDQMLMMASCNALGEGKMLESTLVTVKPTNFGESIQLANQTVYEYADTIVKSVGPKEALETLSKVSDSLVLEDPKSMAQKGLEDEKKRLAAGNQPVKSDAEILSSLTERYQARNDSIKLGFVDKESELLNSQGKSTEAVAKVDDYIKSLDPSSPIVRSAKMLRTRLTLKGSVAPALAFDRKYGDFTSLEALKGKVVILDTFAHWCGPCKASLPDMGKLYADLGSKGLEIVSVTCYYKFYGQEKNLDAATEYAKMADFRKEYGMTWPTLFGEQTNFEHYGISGIPTAFLIDRSGKVRSIHVGYSPESFKEFRAEVEKLVAEK